MSHRRVGLMALSHAGSATSTVTIDCDFTMPRFAASYLLFSEGEAAFIDNNTRHCVPKMLATLGEYGLSPANVEYVIITHVHLDHAGGTGELMQACPNAVLLAHPRASRHMIDPTKLINAVRQVYGDAVYEATYDPLRPVDAHRVQSMEDNSSVQLGKRTLRFIHTRGHANHHMCIMDDTTGEIFTGDSFGIAYPDLQRGKLFIYPTTSPTDYDGALAREAIDKILATNARVAYLTHFGAVDEMREAAQILKADLHKCDEIVAGAKKYNSHEDALKFCKTAVRALLEDKLTSIGLSWSAEAEKILSMDIDLNGAGLAHKALNG